MPMSQPMGLSFFFLASVVASASHAIASRVIDDFIAGEVHYCAKFKDGRIKCLGLNEHGELGIEKLARGPYRNADDLAVVNLGKNKKVVKLALGYHRSCAILDDETLRCWGAFGYPGNGGMSWGKLSGQMGENVPEIALDGKKPRDVVLSNEGGCVLLDDDSIGCWKEADLVAHLFKDKAERPALETFKFEKRPEEIVAGNDFYCARFADGRATCWGGDGRQGQYGAGHAVSHKEAGLKPALIDDKIVQLTAGRSHVCALTAGGAVKCWGTCAYGSLGTEKAETIGTTAESMKALKPIDFGTDLPVRQLSCRDSHCCAVFENSAMKCWGEGMHGRLGTEDSENRGAAPGTMGEKLVFIDLGPREAARKAVLASQSSCALLESDRVKCWGSLPSSTSRFIGGEVGTMGAALPVLKFWSDQ